MNDYLVLIPTTKNLVGITDIIVENRGVIPVVCVSNELKALPISSDYKNFVQNPTGIIEKLTNESSYRIDLTEEVNSGTSWQLGFAIAHLLHKTNNLTFSTKNNLFNNASNIVWASGKLNANLDIIDVDHISSKIENSLPLLKEAIHNDKKIFICVGKKNYKDLYDFLNKIGFLKNIEILSLNNLKDISTHIDINIFSRLKKTYKTKFLKSLVIFFVVLILLSISYIGLKISDNLKKYNQMVSEENFLIEINKDRNSTDFFRSFTAFLFSYIQNFERLNKSDF